MPDQQMGQPQDRGAPHLHPIQPCKRERLRHQSSTACLRSIRIPYTTKQWVRWAQLHSAVPVACTSELLI